MSAANGWNEEFLKFQHVCHIGMDLIILDDLDSTILFQTRLRILSYARWCRNSNSTVSPACELPCIKCRFFWGGFFWRPVNIVYASFTQNRRSAIAMCKLWLTQITGSERESGRRRWKSERWKIQRRKRRQGRIQRRNKRGSHFSGYLPVAVRAAAAALAICALPHNALQ